MRLWRAYVNGVPVGEEGPYFIALAWLKNEVKTDTHEVRCANVGKCHEFCCGPQCQPHECPITFMLYQIDGYEDSENERQSWRNVGGTLYGVRYHIAPA